MRRLVAATLAAVAAGALSGVPAAHSGAATSRARLVLVKADPLRIAGRQFHAGERVRLTATAGADTATRHVRAGAGGSFSTTFGDVQYDPCGTNLAVEARGSDGSRADLKIPQRECPPKL